MKFEKVLIEKRDELNKNELEFLFYIKNNKNVIATKNIKELAEITHYSTGFISKLIKKIGYMGFSEFKVDIQKEINDEYYKKSKSVGIDYLNIESLIKTKKILDQTDFHSLFSLIEQSETIYCYGTGNTRKNYMREFARNLMFVTNKRIISISGMSEFESIPYSIKKGDILIISSNTGDNDNIIRLLFDIKSKGVYILNISPFLDSKLSYLATYNIFYYDTQINLPTREVPFVSYLSFNYCIDRFIMNYIQFKYK